MEAAFYDFPPRRSLNGFCGAPRRPPAGAAAHLVDCLTQLICNLDSYLSNIKDTAGQSADAHPPPR